MSAQQNLTDQAAATPLASCEPSAACRQADRCHRAALLGGDAIDGAVLIAAQGHCPLFLDARHPMFFNRKETCMNPKVKTAKAPKAAKILPPVLSLVERRTAAFAAKQAARAAERDAPLVMTERTRVTIAETPPERYAVVLPSNGLASMLPGQYLVEAGSCAARASA